MARPKRPTEDMEDMEDMGGVTALPRDGPAGRPGPSTRGARSADDTRRLATASVRWRRSSASGRTEGRHRRLGPRGGGRGASGAGARPRGRRRRMGPPRPLGAGDAGQHRPPRGRPLGCLGDRRQALPRQDRAAPLRPARPEDGPLRGRARRRAARGCGGASTCPGGTRARPPRAGAGRVVLHRRSLAAVGPALLARRRPRHLARRAEPDAARALDPSARPNGHGSPTSCHGPSRPMELERQLNSSAPSRRRGGLSPALRAGAAGRGSRRGSTSPRPRA